MSKLSQCRRMDGGEPTHPNWESPVLAPPRRTTSPPSNHPAAATGTPRYHHSRRHVPARPAGLYSTVSPSQTADTTARIWPTTVRIPALQWRRPSHALGGGPDFLPRRGALERGCGRCIYVQSRGGAGKQIGHTWKSRGKWAIRPYTKRFRTVLMRRTKL